MPKSNILSHLSIQVTLHILHRAAAGLGVLTVQEAQSSLSGGPRLATGSSLAWTTSTLHGPPTGSRLGPAAGGRACGMLSRSTSSRPWPPTGGRARWLSWGDTPLPARKSFCTRAAAWQPAPTGCGRSRAASGYRHGSHTWHTVQPLQHIPSRGNPSLALIGPLTHLRL